MLKRTPLFVAAFLVFPVHLSLNSSQADQESQPALKHEVSVVLKLVQVYVTDKKGNPLTDLEKEEFVVYDNGREREITDFEKHVLPPPGLEAARPPEETQESGRPARGKLISRKYFLLFDFAFNNEIGVLKAREAALHFIDNRLQPADEVCVLSYSVMRSLVLHEYLTADRDKVREVVRGLGLKHILGRADVFEEASGESKERGPYPLLRPDVNQALSYIRKLKDLALALRYIAGYKHIILFSSGIPYISLYGGFSPSANPGNTSLRFEFEEMLKELSASNGTIFALDSSAANLRHPLQDSRTLGTQSLRVMAGQTDGQFLGDVNGYETHFETLQKITGIFYVLGYPIDERWDGKHHKIMVKVKRPGCEVRAQTGYFNPKPFGKYSPLEKKLHLVDLALSEKPNLQEPLRFPLKAVFHTAQGKPCVALIAQITGDIAREIAGKEVEIVGIIFDKDETIVKVSRDMRDFSAEPGGDINYNSVLFLDPGEYKCRLVVRNAATGRGAVGAASVVIPDQLR